MKKVIFLFLFFVVNNCLAQEQKVADTLKSGYIKYTYKGYETPFSEKPTDFNAYLNFNENESLFVTGRVGMKEKQNAGSLTADPGSVGYVGPSSSEKGKMTYRNFITKEITYNEYKLAIYPPFVVKDNWVEMKWELLSATKEVAGYKVKKAATVFRGTKYTAWYTESIAFPYGPKKLFGLPGIILELTAHDVGNDNITFTAYEVCYPCENIQKVEAPVEDIVKTIEEEVQFRDNFQYYFVTETNKRFEGHGRLYLDYLPTEKTIAKKRAERVEKIYEWENEDTKRLLPGIDYKKMLDPDRHKNKNVNVSKPPVNQYYRPSSF